MPVIKLDQQLKTLSGAEIEGANGHAGKLVASVLASSNTGNSIKLLDWAIKLHNQKALEIDESDRLALVAIIEKATDLTNLAKGQILGVLELAAPADEDKAPKKGKG